MKKYILGFTIMLSTFCVFGETSNKWMAFREQLDQLDERIQTRKMRKPSIVADSMVGPWPEAFTELQTLMKESWPLALAHLDQIATNDVQKTVVIMAGREISEDEYIDFLEQLLDMTERGALDAQILKFATVVTTGSRRNFHAKNDPRIQAAVERVRELYAGPW